MRLEDKVAVITGGGIGIGRYMALAFAREGAHLVLAGRTPGPLEDAAREIESLGRRALAVPTDVAFENQVKALIGRAIAEFGRIDVLVNNAGIEGPTAYLVDLELPDWQRVLDVNLTGMMLCTRETLKHMLPRRSGSIINVSSAAGKRGFPLRAPYAASKWGVIGFTATVAQEVGPQGIRCNCICPGATEGDRLERVLRARAPEFGLTYEEIVVRSVAGSPLRRMVKPQEVADIAVFLASQESSAMTGQALNVTAGTEIR